MTPPKADDSHLTVEDALFRERVLRARRMTPGEKLAAAFELFELGCATMRAGIAAQDPALDEAGIEAELHRRLRIGRQLKERGIYRPVAEEDLPEGMRL